MQELLTEAEFFQLKDLTEEIKKNLADAPSECGTIGNLHSFYMPTVRQTCYCNKDRDRKRPLNEVNTKSNGHS